MIEAGTRRQLKEERKSQQALVMGGSEVEGGVKDDIRISGLISEAWLPWCVLHPLGGWGPPTCTLVLNQACLSKTAFIVFPKQQTLQYPFALVEHHLLGLDPFENMLVDIWG